MRGDNGQISAYGSVKDMDLPDPDVLSSKKTSGRMRHIFGLLLALVLCIPVASVAQDLRALARVELNTSTLRSAQDGMELRLSLSQGVPFRISQLSDPMRIAIDFREVAFSPEIASLNRLQAVEEVRAGTIRDGWSRLVLALETPLGVDKAWMTVDPLVGSAILNVDFSEISLATFLQGATSGDLPITPVLEEKDLPVIVLDPGHGGVDPGAERDGANEADLMLTFARELRETFLRTGRYDVVLTRDDDTFVSLPARLSRARAAEASVFISLHADAIATGRASGLTVYTLSDDASDAASASLAERQNRSDIVGGIDLKGDDDQVALAMIGLARQTTVPRTDALADILVETFGRELGNLHKRPRLGAGFSVLKAPDIPSVLIELGFLSSEKDLAALLDSQWREKAALAISHALDKWFAQG
ncbi:MAG: N-acetylmuramoyl-L-alanine amidase [Litoreibacter sp.]